MNTFLKIALGFVLGSVCTAGVFIILGLMLNTEEYQLREEVRMEALKEMKQFLDGSSIDASDQSNVHSFELTTKNGIVKLHTYMSKDSVQMLMGRPQSTDVKIDEYNHGAVEETWKYKGSNRYIDEFTIKFVDGKLKSVNQNKESH